MPRYSFKTFGDEQIPIKNAKQANAQKIGESLEANAKRNGGRLNLHAAHEEARDESHPLHIHLEWDDTKAAKLHRIEQIGHIIRILRVDDDDNAETHRAPAFLSIAEANGRMSYRTAAEVKSSLDLQLTVLKAAERDLEAWEARYYELVDICGLVRAARDALTERRRGIEENRPMA